jgi:hypothetical protein
MGLEISTGTPPIIQPPPGKKIFLSSVTLFAFGGDITEKLI